MSVPDIETKFSLKCRDCDFSIDDVYSAGAAQETAHEHINDEARDGSYPNYNHKVEIREYTLIGRS